MRILTLCSNEINGISLRYVSYVRRKYDIIPYQLEHILTFRVRFALLPFIILCIFPDRSSGANDASADLPRCYVVNLEIRDCI